MLTVVVNIAFAAVTLCVIVALLSARSFSLTLVALSVAPLLWANVRFGRRLTETSRKAKESDSAFTTAVQRPCRRSF